MNEDNVDGNIVTPTDQTPSWSNPIEDTDDDDDEEEEDFPIGDGSVIHQQPDSSFFITDRQVCICVYIQMYMYMYMYAQYKYCLCVFVSVCLCMSVFVCLCMIVCL